MSVTLHSNLPVLDHLFICTAPGAPAAELLRQFGLTEGSPNRHPGQGTACRRFFFHNAMLELLWLADSDEAQLSQNHGLRLWDRLTSPWSPFGIILRPGPAESPLPPFRSWEYRPAAMPDLVLNVAADTVPDTPMWLWMASGRRPDQAPPDRRQPLDHSAGFREITGVSLFGPVAPSPEMNTLAGIQLRQSAEHLIQLEFDGATGQKHIDFRPHLPLQFIW